MHINFKQTAVRLFTLAAIATTFAFAAFAQGGDTERSLTQGTHIKQVKVIGRKAGQATFCIETGDAASGNYRLKVWQLMQGQTPEAAVATNKIVVTANYLAIQTKGAGGERTTSPVEPETAKACNDALATSEPAANTAQRTRTKSNNANERLAVVVVDGLPACAKGATCEYILAVEEVGADGTTAKFVTSVQNPYRFSVTPDGAIAPPTSERKRTEVLKSN